MVSSIQAISTVRSNTKTLLGEVTIGVYEDTRGLKKRADYPRFIIADSTQMGRSAISMDGRKKADGA